MGDFASIIAFLGSLVIIAALVVIVLWVLVSLGTSYVLKRLGWKYPWMGWIPVFNVIPLGMAVKDDEGNIDLFGLKLPAIVVALYPVWMMVLSKVPSLGNVLSLVVSILFGGVIYTLVYSKMEQVDSGDRTFVGYLSGLIWAIPMVKFLIYRSKKA